MAKGTIFYLGKFASSTIGAILVVGAILWGIQAYAPQIFADPAMTYGGVFGGGIVAIALPAIAMAKSFFSHERRKAIAGEALLLSFLGAILFLVICVGLTALFNTVLDGSAAGQGDIEALFADPAALAIVVGVALLFLTVMIWVMFVAAIKGEMKKAV